MIRLVRRTLLSLVVGVTAFGAAGWALRPRPTWTAVFRNNGHYPKALELIQPAPDAPLWIAWVSNSENDPSLETHFQTLDAATGGTLANVRRAQGGIEEEGEVLSSGALLIVSHSSEPGGDDRFEHIDGRTGASSRFSLGGRWRIGKDREHLWQVVHANGELQVKLRDARSEGVERVTNVPWGGPPPRDAACDLSADGKWFACCGPDGPSAAVHVLDVEAGTVARRLGVPAPLLRVQSAEDEGPRLAFDRGWLGLWPPDGKPEGKIVTNPDEGEFIAWHDAEPAPPADLPEAEVHQFNNGAASTAVWVANQHRSGATAILVTRRDRAPAQWRKVPFPVPSASGVGAVLAEPFLDLLTPCAFAAAPEADQVVCLALEPSVAASVPAALRKLLPPRWQEPRSVHTKWHQWGGAEWKDVGCSDDEVILQMRPGLYITRNLRQEDGADARISAWPLPPRDPSPPALAIAALCMAGTWWLSAWRYRRRKRLVSAGAA